MGKISSLPRIVSTERRSLIKDGKNAKFPAGPTRASPGPKLVIQAMEAEKEVTKSYPKIEIMSPQAIAVIK